MNRAHLVHTCLANCFPRGRHLVGYGGGEGDRDGDEWLYLKGQQFLSYFFYESAVY